MKENFCHFSANIDVIGINPFVFVPDHILKHILKIAEKNNGPVPVKGMVNKKPFTKTLVKYSGEWRIYINTTMLKNSPKKVGERIDVSLAYDPIKREITMPPPLQKVLDECIKAIAAFKALPPSRRLEITRYIARLKSPKSVDRNVGKAIEFLTGKARFLGRDIL